MPPSARPIEAPTMASSASGVSTTRSVPKRSRRPFVTRKTPPSTPTSSPRTTRSEERRVGKECRSRGATYHEKKKEEENGRDRRRGEEERKKYMRTKQKTRW